MRHSAHTRCVVAVGMLTALLATACASTANRAAPDASQTAGNDFGAGGGGLPAGARVNKKGQVVNKKGKVIGTAEEFGVGGSAGGGSTGGGGSGGDVAAGGGGSGSGGGPGGGSGSVDLQGTIKVGVILASGNPGQAIGASGNYDSDQEKLVHAMVDEINATGGVAGRKLTVVIEKHDQTNQSQEAQTRQANEICTKFTEDEHVFMVIALAAQSSFYTYRCFADHETPIYSELSATDDGDFLRYRPWLLPSLWLSKTRMGKLLALELDRQNFLSKKMGLISVDLPMFKRSAEQALIPGIQRRGGKVIDKVYLKIDYQDIAASLSAAVLRFKQKGINRVLMWEGPGGGIWLIFAREAESQGYRPDYGVTSDENPREISEQMPEEQLPGTKGYGWSLTYDVSDKKQPPLTAKEKRCFAIMKKRAGTNYNHRGSKFDSDGLKFCESFWLMQEALEPARGRQFGRGDVYTLYTALRSSFGPTQFADSLFSRRKADAISVYAPFKYISGCKCFDYTGRFEKVPF